MRNWVKRILAVVAVFALGCVSTMGINAEDKIKSKNVDIDVATATIAIGDVVTLDAVMEPANSTDSLKWSSSNKSVASVNKYGVVTGKAEGSASITVKTSSGKTDKCVITVKEVLSAKELNALFAKNLYTKDQIDTMLGTSSDSSSFGSNWADGTELANYWPEHTTLSNGVTITSVSVKKYHDTSVSYFGMAATGEPNLKGKYLYKVSIMGKVDPSYVPPAKADAMTNYKSISIMLMRSDGAAGSRTGGSSTFFTMTTGDRGGLELKQSYSQSSDGSFTLTGELHHFYIDYDQFMIY